MLIENGVLKVFDAGCDTSDGTIFDASGLKIVPGFIDIHMHGAMGVDISGATAKELGIISRFLASKGTTSWQCSIITDTKEQTEWCIKQVVEYLTDEHPVEESRVGARLAEESVTQKPDGAQLLGIHLEGPFLAKEYKGAMPEHLLKTPDIDLIRHYQELAKGKIKYITLAPELDGAVDLISECNALGIAVGLGHSNATYDVAMEAIGRGATVGTHVGNAMRLLHQREPGIFGAIMDSDVYGEMICDGRHVAPGTLRVYAKCKGLDHLIAITDSIMAAGLPDGVYKLGVNDVEVVNGDAMLAGSNTRAGSTLTQDVALKNMLAIFPNTLEEILPTLTENPAKAMHVWAQKGSIENGKDADLVLLDEHADVVHVFVKGKRVR